MAKQMGRISSAVRVVKGGAAAVPPAAEFIVEGKPIAIDLGPAGKVIQFFLETKKSGKKSAFDPAALKQQIEKFVSSTSFDSLVSPSPDLGLQLLLQKEASGALLKRIHETFDLSREQMSTFLEVTPKTLLEREKKPQIPFVDAERLARYARAWAASLAVFEDRDYATEWLHTANPVLGGSSPFDLLKGAQGELAVLRELTQIEHGLPV